MPNSGHGTSCPRGSSGRVVVGCPLGRPDRGRANAAFHQASHASEGQPEGRSLYDLGDCQWDIPRLMDEVQTAYSAPVVPDVATAHVPDAVRPDYGVPGIRLRGGPPPAAP